MLTRTATLLKYVPIRNTYDLTRYWLLFEALQVRARLRVGTASEVVCRRDRKSIQRDMVKLRATRAAI